jgi:hypothetical protein
MLFKTIERKIVNKVAVSLHKRVNNVPKRKHTMNENEKYWRNNTF